MRRIIIIMKLGKIAIVFILFFFLCSSDKIIIDDTRNYIAFHRNPEAGNIIDFDVWLININTKEETRITQNLEYWEYAPIWISDSELLYLIEPQEKTMTETDIVYINFRTGKRKLLDFWTWRDDPGSDGISADLRGNIYYADDGADLVYRISLKEKEHNAKEILSIASLKRLGLAEVAEAVISPDGTKLLLVASDSAKYERLTKARKFFYDDIYLYKFANNSLIKLISGDSTYEDPIWIGNDTIVFCSNCDGNYELYLMELKDKNMIRLTSTEDISEMEPTVSPDHQQIAYMRYQGEYRFKDVEIWIMDLKTKETWFLTKGGSPAWSPAK